MAPGRFERQSDPKDSNAPKAPGKDAADKLQKTLKDFETGKIDPEEALKRALEALGK